MKKITDRQREVLDFICSYIAKNQVPPTIREIGNYFDCTVRCSHEHVKALERKGYIATEKSRPRSIRIIKQDDELSLDSDQTAIVAMEELLHIPILGGVPAGTPLDVEENRIGTFPMSSQFLGTGSYFAMYVQGNSMCNAGIMDGDLAVFRKQSTAENGSIVIAIVNQSITHKRFFRQTNRICLKAENPQYKDIYSRNVSIAGRLVHVCRHYT